MGKDQSSSANVYFNTEFSQPVTIASFGPSSNYSKHSNALKSLGLILFEII